MFNRSGWNLTISSSNYSNQKVIPSNFSINEELRREYVFTSLRPQKVSIFKKRERTEATNSYSPKFFKKCSLSIEGK